MNDLHQITVETESHSIVVESLEQTVTVELPVNTQIITRVEAIVIENGGVSVIGETPSGLINGANTTFTTEFNFLPASLQITLNGLAQKSGLDYYTVGNQTIIFYESLEIGDIILVDYEVN
mgnify:CR=1 FL=1